MKLKKPAVIVLFALCFGGCSPAAKDKFLRTFFDGVPTQKEIAARDAKKKSLVPSEKQETENKANAGPAKAAEESTYIQHPPFADRDCSLCHEGQFSQKLVAKGKELCFTCHDDFLKGAKVKHYPAEEGMCLDCHLPHESKFKHLLKREGQALCLECHDMDDLKATHDEIGEDDCTSCHDPHKGDEKLLK